MTVAPAVPHRSVPRAIALLAAALGVLLTMLVSPPHEHSGAADRAAHGHPATAPTTPGQVAFHDEMRRLWEDHATWTRLAIVTFAQGSPAFDATAARLLANQDDIGDAIVPFYGEDAGAALTALLREHILVAVDLLEAAKAGDGDGFAGAHEAWYANGDEIAEFLASANPKHWPADVMRAAMKAHLDQTLAEAAHELAGDFAASVRDYDEVHHHILAMADLLSSGIGKQFPEAFHGPN